jgi:hypothetical protein
MHQQVLTYYKQFQESHTGFRWIELIELTTSALRAQILTLSTESDRAATSAKAVPKAP